MDATTGRDKRKPKQKPRNETPPTTQGRGLTRSEIDFLAFVRYVVSSIKGSTKPTATTGALTPRGSLTAVQLNSPCALDDSARIAVANAARQVRSTRLVGP